MRLMPALGSLGPRTLERSFMSVTYANPFTPHFSVGLDMFCNHRWGFEVTAAPPRYSIPYVQIKRVRAQLRLLAWWCHTWKVLACRNGSLSAYCAPTCETHNLRVLTRHAISCLSLNIGSFRCDRYYGQEEFRPNGHRLYMRTHVQPSYCISLILSGYLPPSVIDSRAIHVYIFLLSNVSTKAYMNQCSARTG